ncbi:hypothetical protein AWENTII_002006 [Aspergillus wentii]
MGTPLCDSTDSSPYSYNHRPQSNLTSPTRPKNVRMYKFQTRSEWLFFLVLLVQAILVTSLEVLILSFWQAWVRPTVTQVPASYTAPVYVAIFIIGSLYELFLSVDAIYHKNNILLFAVCISNVCCLIFSGMQYMQMHHTIHLLATARDVNFDPLVDLSVDVWARVQPALLVNPIVIGLSTLAMWPLACQLHKEFAWAIYLHIHAGSDTRARYLAYEIYLVFSKLDFYFILGFILQYDLIDVHFQEPEYSLTLALVPFSLMILVSGVYFVRLEFRIGMAAVILCHLGMVAYLVSRIVALYLDPWLSNTTGKDMMLLFAFTGLTFSVITFAWGIRCMLNFGHGLKPLFFKGKKEAYSLEDARSPSAVYSFPNRRLSLD